MLKQQCKTPRNMKNQENMTLRKHHNSHPVSKLKDMMVMIYLIKNSKYLLCGNSMSSKKTQKDNSTKTRKTIHKQNEKFNKQKS